MSLDQLRSYYGTTARPKPSQSVARDPNIRLLTSVPDAVPVVNPHGYCLVRSVRSGEAMDGGGAEALDDHLFAALGCAPPEPGVQPRPVYLDTETTGLATASGTYAFLVGLGYFDAGKFVVRQFFLPDPSQEPAFLHALSDLLAEFSTVVTFNGKSFDVPLLETRYIRSRSQFPLSITAHLDMLHPARRLWGQVVESCSLKDLEASILLTGRSHEDVPGWEIPALYFRYQRTGRDEALARIFYHNEMDVRSLAALTALVQKAVTCPTESLSRAPEFFGAGCLLERAGEKDEAVRCWKLALEMCADRQTRRRCLHALALACKRAGLWDDAISYWRQTAALGGVEGVAALIEAAKYFEHVERNVDRALEYVGHALGLLDLFELDSRAKLDADLQHRLERLLARRARLRAMTPNVAGRWEEA